MIVALDDFGCPNGLVSYPQPGGNNIEDLTSVDSLNSFPNLKVRFCKMSLVDLFLNL